MQSAYGQCTNKISNRADLSYCASVLYVFSSGLNIEYKDELCVCTVILIKKLKIILIYGIKHGYMFIKYNFI